MALDVEKLLEPVSDDAPSGESIEYDSSFIALETLAKGVAEERTAEGVLIREAEEPDWREIIRIGVELAERSKDLRVAMYLVRAELSQSGLSGFMDGLALISGYLTRYWESVHPQLDPDDDNDPSARVNTVAALTHNETILRGVRLAPLTQSRQFGRVNYRQVAISTGAMPMPTGRDAEERLPDSGQIEAAFSDTAMELLEANQTALGESRQFVKQISEAFDSSAGYGVGPELGPLDQLLREIKTLVDRQIALRGGAAPAEADGSDDAAAFVGSGGGFAVGGVGGGGGGGGPVGSGVIRSRADVTLLLDKIVRYYADNEPSSPVPLILARVKKLVTMDFMQILEDLTPEGVDQFRTISGIKPPVDDDD